MHVVSGSWLISSLVLATWLCAATGCVVSDINLNSKQCPCSSGWICDTRNNLCVRTLNVGDREVAEVRDDDRDGDDVRDRDASVQGGRSDAASMPELDAEMVVEPQSDASSSDPGESDAASMADAGEPVHNEPDASVVPSCAPPDTDCDTIAEDGDTSGLAGDSPCRQGLRAKCDDNCPRVENPWQDDGDNDGIGDACDPDFCPSSSMIIAVGYGDQVHVTTDHGDTWLRRTPGAVAQLTRTPNWEDVVHGRGTWVINNSHGQASTWARSVDGQTWTVHSLPAWLGTTGAQGVGYADGLWLLGSDDGRLAVSYDDGLTFSNIGVPNGWNGTSIESFAHHEGRTIAVGDAGQISFSDTPDIASSWNTRLVGTGDFKQIFVVSGVWVAAGKSTCFFSENRGQDWTSCGAPSGSYYGLHYAKGLWMLGSLSSGAPASRNRPDAFTELMFADSGGAWPVFGDCTSGRWFAGDKAGDADHGLRMSEDEGKSATPKRVIFGQGLPIYGIAGN